MIVQPNAFHGHRPGCTCDASRDRKPGTVSPGHPGIGHGVSITPCAATHTVPPRPCVPIHLPPLLATFALLTCRDRCSLSDAISFVLQSPPNHSGRCPCVCARAQHGCQGHSTHDLPSGIEGLLGAFAHGERADLSMRSAFINRAIYFGNYAGEGSGSS